MSRLSVRSRAVAGLAGVLLVLSGCGGGDEDGGSDGDASGACGGTGGTVLAVESTDFQFEPSELSAPAGEQVSVEFTNSDEAPHTFTVEEFDCDTGSVESGQTAELSFTMPDADTGWICTIHPDMKGTLTPE